MFRDDKDATHAKATGILPIHDVEPFISLRITHTHPHPQLWPPSIPIPMVGAMFQGDATAGCEDATHVKGTGSRPSHCVQPREMEEETHQYTSVVERSPKRLETELGK